MGDHPKLGREYRFETDETNADGIVPIDAVDGDVTVDVFGSPTIDRTVWSEESMIERIEKGDLSEAPRKELKG